MASAWSYAELDPKLMKQLIVDLKLYRVKRQLKAASIYFMAYLCGHYIELIIVVCINNSFIM